ncbi:hypothetical protein CERSUDRAFT_99697 [Gelatoporia subvermispora B]|uniref:Uncharacterized protein n=1 Tax=Ceriporiopsis subvermispora (strain B) TaxID=914234 RepID=M2R0C0_CERS8|nr:hypothetical protein CERSUDRAFT_99697 [Gelatoporia subvermispora B]
MPSSTDIFSSPSTLQYPISEYALEHRHLLFTIDAVIPYPYSTQHLLLPIVFPVNLVSPHLSSLLPVIPDSHSCKILIIPTFVIPAPIHASFLAP